VHYQFADERIGPTIPCKHIFCAAVGGKRSLWRPREPIMPRPRRAWSMPSPRQIVNARHEAAR